MTERDYRGPDSRTVQEMFAGIAHRYDFLNHFLSLSIDRRWRRLAVNKVRELTSGNPPRRCLDLCSGTGDLALALNEGLQCEITAADFCHPMLKLAVKKSVLKPIYNVEADALCLPFSDSLFGAVTIAFGLRNLEDPFRGLIEIRRVMQPGAALVVLEFSRPVVPVLRQTFTFYFHHVLPKLGAFISGNGSAYQYLPDSVGKFPSQIELLAMLGDAGFKNSSYRNLSGGIAALHWGIA